MPNPIRCPECSATLRPKVDLPPGKKIRCPKCGSAFAVTAQKSAPPADEWDDGFDDDWGKPAPPPAATKRRAPAEEPTGPVPTAVWIGTAVAVLLIACGLGLWVVLDPGPDAVAPAADDLAAGGGAAPAAVEAPFSLDLMPADADIFLHLRVADLLATPAVGAMIPEAMRAQMNEPSANPYGIGADQVETVTLGFRMAAPFRQLLATAPIGGENRDAARQMGEQAGMSSVTNVVTVIRFRADWSPERMRTPEGEPAPLVRSEYAGQTLFALPPDAAMGSLALWSPDPRTLVVGRTPRVKTAIDGRETPFPARTGFAGLSGGAQLALAVAPEEPLAGFTGGRQVNDPADPLSPEALRLVTALDEHLLAGNLSLTADRGLTGEARLITDSVPAAAETAAALRAVTASGEDWRASLATLPPALGDLLTATLDSFTVEADGPATRLRFVVPDTLTEIAPQLPILIMGAMSRPEEG